MFVDYWENINNKLINDFKLQKKGTIYENITGNLISYMPLNNTLNLVFVSNIESIISKQSLFWLYAVIYFIISNSIQQLTDITNQNSASAEEMSASAEELSTQAGQLKEIIAYFNINQKSI